jgi:hypothetical protein
MAKGRNIEDHYDDGQEFEDVLVSAEQAADGYTQTKFVTAIRKKWEEYGMRAFLTEQDNLTLRAIAGC